MFSSKTETHVTADKSFLKVPGNDSSDFNLLNETNQSFEDWLDGLSVPSTPASERRNFSNYSPTPSREINFEGTLMVDGYMAGVVYSPEGTLIVGENGEIDGDIFVKAAIIHGAVRGDIRTTMNVELGSSCKVIGDIETLKLVMQPGAVFEGRCMFSHPATDEQDSLANDQPAISLAAAN